MNRTQDHQADTAYSSLVEVLRGRALTQPGKLAFTFLADGERLLSEINFQTLDQRARAIASYLQGEGLSGGRALLLYPSGQAFVEAFLGCLYAGVVAVPAYPPRNAKQIPRIQLLLQDSGARALIGSDRIHSRIKKRLGLETDPGELRFIDTTLVPSERSYAWQPPEIQQDNLAFLQYTSGSTGSPKGVMVSHGNLLVNLEDMDRGWKHDADSVIVTWLPLFHDMGLIYGMLEPLFKGIPCVMLTPEDFLQKPLRWLKAISDYKGTHCAAPDFAYALCANKIAEHAIQELDLSSWQVAVNGAEPVRPQTLEAFSQKFGAAGFRPETFCPGYGLAETTLKVTSSRNGDLPLMQAFSIDGLLAGKAIPVEQEASAGRVLVGCGRSEIDTEVNIVHPETGERCEGDVIGEIWVRGKTIARGYWEKEEATRRTFQAVQAPETNGHAKSGNGIGRSEQGHWMRTGDLGFWFQDQLFITGRIKDVLIFRGKNYAPQDLELTAENSHPSLRKGASAAVSVDVAGERRLVILQEVERTAIRTLDAEAVMLAIRHSIAESHDLQVHGVVLLVPGKILKTSSGKIQRQACKLALEEGKLSPLAEHYLTVAAQEAPAFEDCRDLLLALPPGERFGKLSDLLIRILGHVTGLKPEILKPESPLNAAGLASLQAVSLSHLTEQCTGVEIPVSWFLKGPEIREWVERCLSELEQAPGQEAPSEMDQSLPETWPLTENQKSLWFLHLQEPANTAYYIFWAVEVRGSLGDEAFLRAWNAVLERHPGLACNFKVDGLEPVCVQGAVPVPEIRRVGDDQLDAALAATSLEPFDLEEGPLFRIVLFRTESGRQVLHLVIHHILSDLWTLEILFQDFIKALRNPEILRQEPAAGSYHQFQAWQQRYLDSERGIADQQWWLDQFHGSELMLELPTDRPRATAGVTGGRHFFDLEPGLVAQLEDFCKRTGSTFYSVFLAALKVLFSKYSRQEDIIIGALASGRQRAGWRDTAGYYVNMLPLRSFPEGNKPFLRYLEEVRGVLLDGLDRQSFPFSRLVSQLIPDRQPGLTPVVQAAFLLQDSHLEQGIAPFSLEKGGMKLEVDAFQLESISLPVRDPQFDITLVLSRYEAGMTGLIEFNAGLFDASTIERMAGHFRELLLSILKRPRQAISRLNYIPEAELDQLLNWGRDRISGREFGNMVEQFVRWQKLQPEAPAIWQSGHSLSYSEFGAMAWGFAEQVRAAGLKREAIVGIYLERSPEQIAAALGILAAGGIVVPLSPEYPRLRNQAMISQSGLGLIITSKALNEEAEHFDVNLLFIEDAASESSDPPSWIRYPDGESTAFILYTSGSTGKPKGIMVPHRTTLRAIESGALEYGPERVMLNVNTFPFDIGLFEVWFPLMTGGKLAMLPPGRPSLQGVRDAIAGAGVDTMFPNTAFFHLLAEAGFGELGQLKQIMFGGDKPSDSHVEAFVQAFPQVRVINCCGPTETGIIANYFDVPADQAVEKPIPLGKAVPETELYILDQYMQPVPIGVTGELYIGGASQTHGYFRDPGKSACSFLPNPLLDVGVYPEGAKGWNRIYASGDLFKWKADGNLQIQGRADFQIKVRGYRVEPGEIEHHLRDMAGVTDSLVLPYVVDGQTRGLRAYLVAPDTEVVPGEEAIRQDLAAILPAYMVPDHYFVLGAWPMTPNHKIDRKALPLPDLHARGFVAPQGAAEEKVAACWNRILKVEQPGREDHFFQLGGDSLKAIQLSFLFQEAWGEEIPVNLIFTQPVLKDQAAFLAGFASNGQTSLPGLPALERLPVQVNYALSPSQEELWYLHLREAAQSVYNVPGRFLIEGPLDVQALEMALYALIERHAVLRTRIISDWETPRQVILNTVSWNLPVREVEEAELSSVLEALALKAFRFEEEALFHFELLTLSEDRHYLALNFHHILSDGGTLTILFSELTRNYAALSKGLALPTYPEHPIRYVDYCHWQLRMLQGGYWQESLDWWKGYLADAPEAPLRYIASKSYQKQESFEGEQLVFSIDQTLKGQLTQLGNKSGASLFMVLEACLAALLHAWSGQRDLVIGIPVTSRTQAELETLAGYFVNTVASRIQWEGDLRFEALLTETRDAFNSSYQYRQVPYVSVLEHLKQEACPAPHLQVVLAPETSIQDTYEVDGVCFTIEESHLPKAKFDLNIRLRDLGDGIEGVWEYKTGVFRKEDMTRMNKQFVELLERVVAAPDQPLTRLLKGFYRPEAIRNSAFDLKRAETTSKRTDSGKAVWVAPEDPIEESLAGLWAEILHHDNPGRQDDFFNLGGNSLMAMKLAFQLQRKFGESIPAEIVFEFPVLSDQANYIFETSQVQVTPESEVPVLERQTGSEPYPLSPGQVRLWLKEKQLEKQTPLLNIVGRIVISGQLNTECLNDTLSFLIERHEVLRSRIRFQDDQPYQVVLPSEPYALAKVNLPDEDLDEALLAFSSLAFELEDAPPFRMKLFSVSDSLHYLAIAVHHIVTDGWSLEILVEELATTYAAKLEGRSLGLSQPEISFGDFASWQNRLLESGHWDQDIAWWKSYLEGAPRQINLIPDRSRPSKPSFKGGEYSFEIGTADYEAIMALARSTDSSLFLVMQTAYAVLFSRYTLEDEVLIGAPVSSRQRSETEGLFGFFVNMVTVRNRLEGDPGFRDLLVTNRDQFRELVRHQDVPFSVLVEYLAPAGVQGISPFFQVAIAVEQSLTESRKAGEVTMRLEETPLPVTEFDMHLYMLETADGLKGRWKYNADIFEPGTVKRMTARFVKLLQEICRQPALPISRYNLEDYDPVPDSVAVSDWPVLSIPEAFDDAVKRYPEAVAVRDGEVSLTYQELKAKADSLAAQLYQEGIRPGDLVGIGLERSYRMVIAILGVLKTGAAYLPLDLDHPDERLRFQIADASCSLVLTEGDLREGFEGVSHVLFWKDLSWPEPTIDFSYPHPDDYMVLLYTSGTTGKPKGATHPHRTSYNLVFDQEFLTFDKDKVWLLHSSISFDVSCLELWGALLHGGILVVMPHGQKGVMEFSHVIRKYGVNSSWFTTSLFNIMVDEASDVLKELDQIIFGGESASAVHVRKAYQLLPDTQLVNGYGPTENIAYSTANPLHALPEGHLIPIGRSLKGRETWVLDKNLEPVPHDIPGEVWVAGKGLAHNYYNRRGKTASMFLPYPWGPAGSLMYRSGDIARRRENGLLEFVARVDKQVKLRGFRIEPEEIESILNSHEGIVSSFVMVVDLPGKGPELCAYVVPLNNEGKLPDGLKTWVADQIPAFMVPAAWVVMEALPLNANQKVDHRALPLPETESQEAGEAPQGEIEEALAELWEAILGQPVADRNLDFFAAGGHSLSAIRMTAKIRKAMKLEFPVDEIFNRPTIKAQAAYLEKVARPVILPEQLEPLDFNQPLQLAFTQERLWFLDQFETDTATYNLTAGFLLKGSVSPDKLEQALNYLIERHLALRLSFGQGNAGPVQHVHASRPVTIRMAELNADLPVQEAVQALYQEELFKRFNLKQDPLVRMVMAKVDAETWVMIPSLHHIIGDGWSVEILVRELGQAYNAFAADQVPELSAVPFSFPDYARWQRLPAQRQVYTRQLRYWEQKLQGMPDLLPLPLDRQRPAVRKSDGDLELFRINPELRQKVADFANEQGVSLFMLTQAAFAVLLSRYTGQVEIPVGTPVANRNQPETHGIIGFFANTLVLRNRVDVNGDFAQFLQHTRALSLEAFANQDLPFERLVEMIKPDRSLSYSPLFQVMFSFQASRLLDLKFDGMSVKSIEMPGTVAKFDLSLSLEDDGTELSGVLEYSTALFDAWRIKQFCGHYVNLLEKLIAAPERKLGSLELSGAAEHRQLLSWSYRGQAAVSPGFIPDFAEATAARFPDKPVIRHDDRLITAGEFNAAVNRLAARLIEAGIGREKLVGLCLPRSADMMIAIMACWKSGAGYVPIDPDHPGARKAHIQTECAFEVLMINESDLANWPAPPQVVICPDRDKALLASYPDENPNVELIPDQLAYIIYTSGSTGKPKGVQVSHRGLVNLVERHVSHFDFNEIQSFYSSAAPIFDASVIDYCIGWYSGVLIDLGNESTRMPGLELLNYLETHRLNIFSGIPSVLAALPYRELPALKVIVLGGEALSESLRDIWGEKAKLYNIYGPTEITVDCSMEESIPGSGKPSIGIPHLNVPIYLLDSWMNPVPAGIPGELYIGGPGVARGYLKRPGLTASRFVPNPFADEEQHGSRLYRTGDLGSWLPDGRIDFLGRKDDQVKLRGFRIELSEIEAVLGRHAQVEECAVLLWKKQVSNPFLAAYIRLSAAVSDTTLKNWLLESLPEYMVPGRFIRLERFPLNISGKLDRKALPDPTADPGQSRSEAKPETPMQELVSEVWKAVLGAEIHDIQLNFFEAGGHSLALTRVQVLIHQKTGKQLPVVDLFRFPTIETLASHLDEVMKGEDANAEFEEQAKRETSAGRRASGKAVRNQLRARRQKRRGDA